jgi:hypothetical protein
LYVLRASSKRGIPDARRKNRAERLHAINAARLGELEIFVVDFISARHVCEFGEHNLGLSIQWLSVATAGFAHFT